MKTLTRNPALPMTLRLALREMRSGLQGFRIFMACLILGVAAIAGVGSLTAALVAGMQDKGRALLTADAELRSANAPLPGAVRDWLAARDGARVMDTLRLRTNAFAPASDERTLVEMRAVDSAYPYYGALELTPAMDTAAALEMRDGRRGVVLDVTLADRLDIAVGDPLKLGDAEFELRALIEVEPDRANYGFQLGPTAMIHWAALDATGLVETGSLLDYYTKIALPSGTAIESFETDIKAAFPDRAWRLRTHKTSAPGIRRVVEQMGAFLTLVGLTALAVGGVGVGNAVRAWLDRKTDTIATLKVLGAGGGAVFGIYLTQVMLLAALAVLIGLALGAGLPFAIAGLLSDRLPVPPMVGIYPEALITAALFGLLITLAFTVWPLGRARDIPAARLFRDIVAGGGQRPRGVYIALVAVSGVAVVSVAVLLAERPALAGGFALAAAVAFILLRGTAGLLQAIARRLPRPRRPGLRLALANLHRPGAATGPVVISLGLGLTLFAALALVEGNMNRAVNAQIPDRAPAFFFVDIQPWQYDDFVATARAIDGVAGLATVPSLRGPITHVDGVPSDAVEPEGSGWVLRGDRGISYAVEFPEGNELVAGKWWPADYTGPPLISMAAEEARDLGLDIGDTLTVSVLGRSLTGEIASLRRVEWATFGFNFVVLFDPHTLADAPHPYMATLEASDAAEQAAYRALTDQFPNVTAVRIKEILTSINDILADIGNVVRGTAVVAVLAGILVLAGAMAAGHRHRVYDSVIMKVLGAVRADVLRAYVIEYALLGLLTGLVALVLGGVGGWLVVTRVLGLEFVLMPLAMAGTVTVSALVTVAFGLASTWTALSVRPAQALRAGAAA